MRFLLKGIQRKRLLFYSQCLVHVMPGAVAAFCHCEGSQPRTDSYTKSEASQAEYR